MTLPASPEAESTLIARLLVNPAQLGLVSGRITPDDFYTPRWRDAYSGMVRLSEQHRNIDLVSLRELGVEIDDPIAGLTVGHHAPLEDYAETIRRHSFRRRTIQHLDDLTRQVYSEDDPALIVGAIQTTVTQIAGGIDDDKLLGVSSVIDEYLPSLGAPLLRGLSYGFQSIDEAAGPMEPGDMVVVCARPGVGKTILAEQVLDFIAAGSRLPVLFCSLEMSRKQLTQRAVSRYARLDSLRVRKSELALDELARARQVLEDRRSLNLWYEDDPAATTASLRTVAAKLRLQHGGVQIIGVDYLGLLKDKGDNEYQRVTRISQQLKMLARENDCPVMALAQLNRQSAFREDGHPRLSDLRDSGGIEQDADVVLGLFAPDDWTLDIDCLKNRSGPAGWRIQLRRIPSQMRLVEQI